MTPPLTMPAETGSLPVLSSQKMHYLAVRQRLGAVQSPAAGRSAATKERLVSLIQSDTAPLPHVRPKRTRDVMMVVATPDMPILPVSPRKVIVREVCEKHGVSWLDITSNRRSAPIVTARNEAFYRLRNETTMSFPEIGRLLGGKDHSTVIHGMRRHEAAMQGKVYKPSWRGRSNKAYAEILEAEWL